MGGKPENGYTIPLSEYLTQHKEMNTVLTSSEGIQILDLSNLFCDDSDCYAMNADFLYYKDSHHISNLQAERAGEHIEKFVLRRLAKEQQQ